MESKALRCDFIDVPAAGARLWLAFVDETLHQLSWSAPGAAHETALKGRCERGALPSAHRDLLERYFAGEAVDLGSLPVDPAGTAFQRAVWQALRRIPRGQVRSYAGIASDLGKPRAMRAVGGANGHNPIAIVIPCHRVIEANMLLGGYTGGVHYKRFLLELEGVRVVGERVQPGQLDLL